MGVFFASIQDKFKMLVQGDDNALSHSPDLLPDWGRLLRLGFKCDNIHRNILREVQFCSNMVYSTERGKCFGPKPGRVLAKLCVFINPPMFQNPYSVIRGVAMGLFSAVQCIEPLKIVVERLLILTRFYTAYHMHDGDWKLHYIGSN